MYTVRQRGIMRGEFAFVITEVYFVTAAKPGLQGACDNCDVRHGPTPPIITGRGTGVLIVRSRSVGRACTPSKYDDRKGV